MRVNLFYALITGILISIEGYINSKLSKEISASFATMHSLITGAIILIIINIINRDIIKYKKIFAINPIWLTAGICTSLIVYLYAKSITEIGISNVFIIVLSSQLISGFLLDFFTGNIGMSWNKLIGLGIFLIGMIIFINN